MTEKSKARRIDLCALTQDHAATLLGYLEGIELSGSEGEIAIAKRVLDYFEQRYHELVSPSGEEVRSARHIARAVMKTSARMVAYISPDGYVEGRGFRVSFVVEGEDGHRPTGTWPYTGAPGEILPWFWGHDLETAKKLAERYNEERGVSKEMAALIIARSMRGPR